MPNVEEQVRSYVIWVHETWPEAAAGEPVSHPEPSSQHSSGRRLLVAAAVLIVVGVVGTLVAVSGDEPDDEQLEAAAPTTQPAATSVATTPPLAAPLWSGPLCENRTIDSADDRFFPWVEMPDGFEWWGSELTCGVLDDQFIRDEWRLGPQPTMEDWEQDPEVWRAAQDAPRVMLMRIELGAAGLDSSEEEGRATSVNGKPARFLRSTEGQSAESSRFELQWVQDDNGKAILVTEGISEEATLAIADSFDRGVEELGPRNPRRELTRDEAIERVLRMTSAIDGGGGSGGAKRMTWADIAEGAALPNATAVDPATVVWVVGGGGDAIPQNGVGDPIDHWGIVVIDAMRNEVLAILTGGAADGARWPPFFDSLPDHPAE